MDDRTENKMTYTYILVDNWISIAGVRHKFDRIHFIWCACMCAMQPVEQ